ncbi:MAG TPA: fused MFS/spermidine synthase [Verrucomicrobiae bacterium]|jgi:spermidine synthase|nr:fused MFS/spermidine synthase [Verrucomicrobiae bacterium]
MRTATIHQWTVFLALAFCAAAGRAGTIFERISAYHHILVMDDDATQIRTLSFNGSWETKMSLTNPLTGHFEYTEYFQMPWLWNHDIKHVLMAGLGGGSTQRAWQHYYTNVLVDTVEIDPVVVDVAHKYFGVTESPILRIHTNDARVFLRRSTNTYDVILMDAYATTRYGSSIPPHLTTREFFEIASDHLGANGVLAYNVIGQVNGERASIIGALYRTLREVFPQVYLFPANESQNVVMVATKSNEHFDTARVEQEGDALMRSGTVTLPTFPERLKNFRDFVPPMAATSPVLTDDYAPIESLLQGRR